MKQHSMDGQALSSNHQVESATVLKYGVLILGLGILGLVLLSGLFYLLSSGTTASVAVNPAATIGAEQTLSADYVLETDFLMGRYLLPLFISLLFTGAMLFWVLGTHKKA